MSAQRKFVCGFYGARDAYEVPLALEEAGLLESLLTDFYGETSLLTKLGIARAARRKDGLPVQKVHGSLPLTVVRNLAGRFIRDSELQNHLTDQWLSWRIGRQAARLGAHIFTYEPYAVPRPPGGFPDGRRQVVFYYHPHVDTEDAIYRADQKRFPEFYGVERVTDSPWRRRTADAWKHADLVVCASSFTKQSLIAAGMDERRIAVVPYGTDHPKAEVTNNGSLVARRGERLEARGAGQEGGGQRAEVGGRRPEDRGQRTETGGQRSDVGECEGHEAGGMRLTAEGQRQGPLRLLFVGRNPLRKGLHHLLMAWNAASKRPGDLLTIVCAAKPPEVARLADGRPDIRWLDSVTEKALTGLYCESDALIVPSLCEGFGHVYLEAMSHGCALVGTENSALPDVGDKTHGIFTVTSGDVDALSVLIAEASSRPSMFRDCAEQATHRAHEFNWSRFREGIRHSVRLL